MSSLQKFHRRTLSVGGDPFATLGYGNSTIGYWIGTAGNGTNKLILAPISTEGSAMWGSSGTVRGTTSITDGLTNTNTLYAFGNTTVSGHPAAYACKILTSGGYNTWYLPARNELVTLYTSKALSLGTDALTVPSCFWSSSEVNATTAYNINASGGNGAIFAGNKNTANGGYYRYRAVRRV